MEVLVERPGSSSSRQVLEFIRRGRPKAGAGFVGDAGGDASKLCDGVADGRAGGEGKCPIEREGRRLLLAFWSEAK